MNKKQWNNSKSKIKKERKHLQFTVFKREDLDLPITDTIEMYIYLGTRAYTEYRLKNNLPFNYMTLNYLADYYQMDFDLFCNYMYDMTLKGLIYAYIDDNNGNNNKGFIFSTEKLDDQPSEVGKW